MTTDEIIAMVLEHFNELDLDIPEHNKERTKRINEIKDFIDYSLRYAQLSAEEREDYRKSLEGYPLTPNLIKTLDGCQTKEQRNHYIDMWAKSNYMRQCSWKDYLYGKSEKKPLLLNTTSIIQ